MKAPNKIYLSLKEEVITGKLEAGKKVSISELKNIYKVSLSPIREALNKIAERGLLIHENNRGVRVASLSHEELREIIHLLFIIMPYALHSSMMNSDVALHKKIIENIHLLELSDSLHEDKKILSAAPEIILSRCSSKWVKNISIMLFENFNRYQLASPMIKYYMPYLKRKHREFSMSFIERDFKKAEKSMKYQILIGRRAYCNSSR